ncbi:proton-coupled folate transporter-like isoform X2 [Acanthaster planci]|uniref:Proton-coupled folate transporter n=1 Tax=Acanthaster planci TaxID=133434 RepID=A0A8B7ZII2_ACAPL|nr:proton-coupled folate transporter-like isoform X2 [Acanthaster planci]
METRNEADRSPNCETEPLVKKAALTLSGRERAMSRWVTVEPVLFLASASSIVTSILRIQYVLVRVQESYNYTVHKDSPCRDRNQTANSTDDDTEAQIQADAAHWMLLFNLVGAFPGFVSAIILGALSDRFGRKMFLALSTFGSVAFAGVCTAVMVFNLPLEVFFAGDLAMGLTGGLTLMLAISFSYIADVTSKEERTFRLVVIETVFVFAGLIQIGMEYLNEALGFATAAGIATTLGVLAGVYLMIPGALIETIQMNSQQSDGQKQKLTQSLRNIRRLLYLKGGAVRTCCLLLIYATCFSLTPLVSSGQVRILYAQAEPFCWSSMTIGYYTAFACGIPLIGNIGGFKLLTRCFSDHWIFQISCISAIMAFAAMGLVRTSTLFFLALILTVFAGLCFPVIRGSLSKLVRADEQGVAFSFFACVENFGTYISPIVINAVYMATVAFQPTFVYFLIAGVTFIPSILVAA